MAMVPCAFDGASLPDDGICHPERLAEPFLALSPRSSAPPEVSALLACATFEVCLYAGDGELGLAAWMDCEAALEPWELGAAVDVEGPAGCWRSALEESGMVVAWPRAQSCMFCGPGWVGPDVREF